MGEVLGVGRREQAQLALGLQAAVTLLFFQGHSLFLSNILSFSQSLWDFIFTSKSCPGCSLPAPQSFLVLQILTTHFPPATQCMWEIREPHTSTRYVPPSLHLLFSKEMCLSMRPSVRCSAKSQFTDEDNQLYNLSPLPFFSSFPAWTHQNSYLQYVFLSHKASIQERASNVLESQCPYSTAYNHPVSCYSH